MIISHFCFILFNLKVFGEIVTTLYKCYWDFLNVGFIKRARTFVSTKDAWYHWRKTQNVNL